MNRFFIFNITVIIFFCLQTSCKAQKELAYNKNDTIYIYYKGSDKHELKQKVVHDSIRRSYDIWYKFLFDYELEHIARKKTYLFIYSSHNKVGKKFIKRPLIGISKKELKDNFFTYNDLKSQNEEEIMKFYNYNRFKTVYLIDKNENRKDTVFLRKVQFASNFPIIQ